MDDAVKVFTQIKDFLDYLGTDLAGRTENVDLKPTFAFQVSRHYADLIKKAEQPEALLREVVPNNDENLDVPGFVDDPVGDVPASKSECVIQKYDGRALIMATGACGLHCRFCFRRNYPFVHIPDVAFQVKNWLDVHTDIWEVIFSGGDPLMLSRENFAQLVEAVGSHPEVTTLRIHSRLPVVRPDLVHTHMEMLREMPARFNCVMVAHIDHPDELDQESATVFAKLKQAGWTLLNQMALLKGVNDNSATMAKLCRKMFEQGVLPYYIHQLDHARGVAHFEISDKEALDLVAEIRKVLPGYLVPRLVREIAGEKSKTPIHP